MKKFTFAIDGHQASWMFAPIRTKHSSMELLIRTIKIMLSPTVVPPTQRAGEIALVVSKMSRLIFQSKKKVFSISFPFHVGELPDRLQFRSSSHPNIDSRTTSELLALLDDPRVLSSANVLDFADPICTACDIDTDIWNLFRHLLLWEDGYVRYDDDVTGVNGHKHPQHHVDLFYTQGTTFKAGLKSAITDEQFVDILNIETDCHYLRPAAAH
jgi:hypothetical protein